MVIVASGMVRGRGRLATTSPQHCGHGHSIELGLKPKRGFVFCALFAACRGYTTYSQRSTAVYSACRRNGLENLSFWIIHSVFGGNIFFLYVFKHFWRDISIKLSVYFSFVKELLSCFWRCFKTIIINQALNNPAQELFFYGWLSLYIIALL